MDANSDDSIEKITSALIEQVRSRLLALKKARVAGAKLSSIVGSVLPAGKTFRDFLPDDVDRETASFRVFAERNLAAVVRLTSSRRGTDVLYEIVDSGQGIEPEPGDLWQAFVSVKPTQLLIVDNEALLLSAVAPQAAVSASHTTISQVSLSEHKSLCEAYLQRLQQRGIQVPQLDEILLDYTSASYTKWLKTLRAQTPPLDREWGEFRRHEILTLFRARLQVLGLAETQITNLSDQFANDAPRAANLPVQSVATALEASPPLETVEDQVRRRLHSVIDRMTLEQMNSLMIPFSLFSSDVK